MSSTSLGSREIRALTWGWWLALLIGALSIVAGVIVILKPSNSLSTLAVIVGIFILIDGILEIAGAILGDTESRGLLAVIGTLSVIAGVLLIRHPLGGVRAVALLLGIWLIAAGVVRLISAFAFPGDRIWRIIVALVLGIFGIVIVSAPHIGYATLALITGICFICYGLGMLAVGWAMHTIQREGATIAADANMPT
ncbi:MAG: HdeD family acid-resistance protein [Solirubrobacteraceae bacterium]